MTTVSCAVRRVDGSRGLLNFQDFLSVGDTTAVLKHDLPGVETVLVSLPLNLGAEPSKKLSA